MGKTSKNKRRRMLAEAESTTRPISPGSDVEGDETDKSFLLGLVSPAELAVATRVLNTLTRNTATLKSKHELKGLRGAVFDFQRVNASLAGTGNTLTSRISAALSSSRHTDARVLLAELRLRKLVPKLGALQRWVRDCDAASRADGSFGDQDTLRVLDAILRCTAEGAEDEGEPVRRREEWQMRERSGEDIWSEVQAGTFPAEADKAALAAPFTLLQTTPGPLRLPPNHHPALLFASSPSAISLAPSPATPTTRHPVPGVPGAFLLADVLSPAECRSIVGAAESVGFAPDQPVGDEGASVLAHNLYWLADEPFLDALWARLSHLVPQEVAGGRAMGLNARFRVYRYVPGAIYRPHIDGAWPKSGVDPTTGEYLYDSAPADKPQWSRLTFLIYLNDAFSAGHTTFFLPSPSHSSTLEAYPVKPLAGCALVFPHGDTKGSLLHEGSPVGEGGAKYVIRTDVLYEVKGRKRERAEEGEEEGEGEEEE